ncbi:hypothetical protein ACTQ5K_11140 [Niallia sp. Sow4_A1]|uniref:EamA domain-containing protein n=1 Tax=Niallia hominis TaxID=3133173 RepID=A0ABV1F2I7_9BACI|nr:MULTISPECIES: hypothetical protein [Bacillaceae]MCM3364081.1 hypothetical protein [Niallia sp. MER TA 168]
MLISLLRLTFALSWLTLYFMPKKAVKRYIPSATMSALLVMITVFIGSHYKSWKVKGGNKTRIYNILSVILGPFSVGTIWVLYFTFRKFWIYILANFVQNFIYAFPILTFLKKVGFIKYVRFTRIHHLYASMSYALIIYFFQLYLEKGTSSEITSFDKKIPKM